jgi:hypothetical protein
MVLVESLQARPGRDAVINQFIGTCLIEDSVPMTLARRAAELRRRARKGSAVDALVSALAEPNVRFALVTSLIWALLLLRQIG